MKNLAVLMALMAMLTYDPTPAAAAHGGKHVFITINGLVCDFCARSMEKVFGKKEPVAAVKVDLDAKVVTIDLKEGLKLEDTEIKQGIIDAGYTVVDIKRD